MANLELQVINSVTKSSNGVNTLFGESVDDFFINYGDVWNDMKRYYNRYRNIPTIKVIQERFPDVEDIDVNGDPSYYLDQLRSQYIHSRLESIVTGAALALKDGVAPEAIKEKMDRSSSKLTKYSTSSRDINIMDFEDAEKHYEEVRDRALAMGGQPGIPTGINFVDSAYTSGLAGGDLVVVLGWTARGKSLLTTLIACNAFQHGHKPMIVSLEMSANKVRDRVYTLMGSGLFRNSDLALGDISVDSFRTFRSKFDDDAEFIVVNNDGYQELTPNVIQAKIDQHRPSIIVLDYAQLMSDNSNSSDMTARMRNMSKEYKRLAVANNIPIILISSATPDSAASMNEPPLVEQVAWSKQLCYDADLAFAVHRHNDTNLIEVVCRKNRNGDLFAGILNWDIDNGIVKEEFNTVD